MNKPIIIDGVDVSECEDFEPKAQVMQCHRGAITQRCKENNCHFKQLQRLKAENEKLKKEVSDLNFYIDSYRQTWELDKYRKALEEVHNLLFQSMDIKLKSADKHFSLIDEAIEIVNEVLKDV